MQAGRLCIERDVPPCEPEQLGAPHAGGRREEEERGEPILPGMLQEGSRLLSIPDLQVRIATFEENAGKTNTSTVRIEANGVFVVQRVGAIAEAVIGS